MPDIFTLEESMFYEGINVSYDLPRTVNRGTDGSAFTVKLSDRVYATIEDLKIRITSSTDLSYFQSFYSSYLGTSFLTRWPDNWYRLLEAVGTGNGTNKLFYLDNYYPYNYLVYLNGVLQTETTHYVVTGSTGLITFVTAPGNGVAVTVTYSFRRLSQFSGGYQISPRTFGTSNNQIVSVSLFEVPN